MGSGLVAGRECGTCTVCCVVPTIDDLELQKLPGHTCPNCIASGGCAVYETRPQTCRTFFCGWRTLKWMRDTLRPDRSGVLVMLVGDGSASGSGGDIALDITLLNRAALSADGLAETIAAAIQARISTFLVVPGPPGYTSARLGLNEKLGRAVKQKDKKALLEGLDKLLAQGRASTKRPAVLGVG